MARIAYEDFEPREEWAREKQSDTLILSLPGFKREQLRVQLTASGTLKISGERPLQNGSDKRSRFHKELQVPENSETNRISARFENGVLFLLFPKKPTPVAAQQREVPSEKLRTGVPPPQTPALPASTPKDDTETSPEPKKPQSPPPASTPKDDTKTSPEPKKSPSPPPAPEPKDDTKPPRELKGPQSPPPASTQKDDTKPPQELQKPQSPPPLVPPATEDLQPPREREARSATEGLSHARKTRPEITDREKVSKDRELRDSTDGTQDVSKKLATEEMKGDRSAESAAVAKQQRNLSPGMVWGRIYDGIFRGALKERGKWGEWRKLIVTVVLGLLLGMYVKNYISSSRVHDSPGAGYLGTDELSSGNHVAEGRLDFSVLACFEPTVGVYPQNVGLEDCQHLVDSVCNFFRGWNPR